MTFNQYDDIAWSALITMSYRSPAKEFYS
jgi:hypothetical protein